MKQRLELTWFNKDKALIPTEQGRYGYTWVSPNDPRYCETHTLIKTDAITGTQLPKGAESTYSERADLEPQSDNLLILGESGDVLETLTRVPELVDKYVGKVKCVYIDPPFNTAQTFANYEDNLEHSVWLTMMRDRLIHLHKLLSDEGSIWVHLDEFEMHRMQMVLDEIFGSNNFVAKIAWQKQYGPDNRSVFTQTDDSILVYAKNYSAFKKVRNFLPRSAAQDASYSNPDNDPRGAWKAGDFTAQFDPVQNPRENQRYTLETPAGLRFDPPSGSCWRFTEARYKELLADNRVWFGPKGTGKPAYKRFRSEVMDGRVPETWWTYQEVGHNQDGKKEIKTLFPAIEPFATPKPERLLERVIHIATNPGDIVLDVFAGSATTAAVAQKMGRKWVTCELIEETFTTFTQPRLEKVVNGEDMGGISASSGERIDNTTDGLPDGITPDDAQRFTSLLNKIIAGDESFKKDATVKALKALAKTKKTPNTINWRGGGGFTVAKLSPACFDYNEELDLVTLTEHATGQTLIDSVAAQLRFYLTPNDRHFHGQVGIQHLVVIEGVLDNEKVDDLMSHLPRGHCLVLAATIINEETRHHVRSFKNGSRVVSIPHDLFTYSKNQEVK
ncbi:site-specific DNA-methyltransferase [Corynebacterium callunae]|uniref:Putative DNA restriction-modification system, DNA methylase n=1 Tax=Corynebacterium callunae DSM 20147 TaxID=1121353 RepID=M1UWJ8_9CORY|nr:DNA methyltransferase [Corynebacterium callunae]AGG68072.1 putative DNA restriction-modification system, DNA methylase [Corynebacterium callunae DSM 20147]